MTSARGFGGLVGWAMILVSAVGAARADFSVPLTVTERAHVERTGELAAGGVPLPEGAVKDTSSFAVADDKGLPVPAQFDVLNRWPADGSVRWMLVQFPVTVAADKAATFTLKQGGEPAGPPARSSAKLKIDETADTVAVDTGVIRFTIRKKNFALFDTVTVFDGGTGVPPVEGHGQDAHATAKEKATLGPKLCGEGFTVTTTQPETFTTAADADSKVTLEDVGPLRGTIRVDGRHKDSKGNPLFAYRVRIYAAAGSPAVRVQYTFTHDTGPFTNQPVEVKELAVHLKSPLDGAPWGSFGERLYSPYSMLRIDLVKDKTARMAALDSTVAALRSGTATTGYGTKVEKFSNVGWCSLQNGPVAITAAIRWFWQLFPKALAIADDGSMKIELVPADAKEPAHIYRGMSKTHDLLFVFADKPASELAVGFQHPLHVKCPPAWYCQDTLGFGRLASADYKGTKPQFANLVKTVNDGFDEQINVIREWRGRTFDPAKKLDSYGMMHFGDGFHHFFGPDHTQVQWDNCYYSYTHLLAAQFARSGHDLILDTLREATSNEGDVQLAWQTLDIAAPRVSPGAYHVGGFNEFHNGPSDSWNFYHPIGMMEAFYLTGDRRYQDTALANFNWALQDDGYDMYNNPRSVGAGLRGLTYGYLATGNMSFLQVAREVARKAERFYKAHGHFAPVSNSIFMCPNACEGLCVYQEFTGDPVLGKVLPAIVSAHFRKFAKDPAQFGYAYSNLYTARLGGDAALRKEVETAMAGEVKFSIATGEHHIKEFALGKHALPWAFWYLSDLADTPAAAKPWGHVDLGPERPDRVEIPRIAWAADPKEWGPTLRQGLSKPALAKIDLVYNPDPTRKLNAPTALGLGYDDKNLYLDVHATEPRMDLLKLTVKEDGGKVFSDDSVEIYVAPQTRLAGVKLIVNAAGVRAVSVRGHQKDKLAGPMPGDFPVQAGRITLDGGSGVWMLGVVIPWEKIGVTDPKPGTEVAFNVLRFRVAAGDKGEKPGENSTWHGSSNQLESIGTLVLGK